MFIKTTEKSFLPQANLASTFLPQKIESNMPHRSYIFHIPADLVVNQRPSESESDSNLDLLGLGDVWTRFFSCMRGKIRPIISIA